MSDTEYPEYLDQLGERCESTDVRQGQGEDENVHRAKPSVRQRHMANADRQPHELDRFVASGRSAEKDKEQ